MKTGLAGLLVVAAFSYSGMALAAEERVKQEQPAPQAAQPEKTAPPEGTKDAAPVPRLEAGRSRQQGRDLRHCLDLPDNAAIAKCAGE